MEKKLSVEEQLFCLNYEFKILSEYVTKGHVERWVKNCIPEKIETEHLERYIYACNYSNNKEVLDIAGGSGYGTFLLATEGKAISVHSVDLDAEAVKYADLKYPATNINRVVENALRYIQPLEYDLVVSFETIEHLDDPITFLKNIYTSLRENGELIISSPVVLNTTKETLNKYHTIEWSFNDFQELVGRNFEIKDTYLQTIVLQEDLKDSLLKRIWRKIIKKPYKERIKPVFEKYTHQYRPDEMVAGYQMIHCVKKS